MVIGSLVSAAVFCLLLVTGYLRPSDLQFMWRRGLANLRRDEKLAALASHIATQVALDDSKQSIPNILVRLAEEGAISGALYSSPERPPLRVGDYDEQAKGVRSSIPVSGSQSDTVTLLWRERRSGPSQRELSSLTELLAGTAKPGG
jgi:hypothetical protein